MIHRQADKACADGRCRAPFSSPSTAAAEAVAVERFRWCGFSEGVAVEWLEWSGCSGADDAPGSQRGGAGGVRTAQPPWRPADKPGTGRVRRCRTRIKVIAFNVDLQRDATFEWDSRDHCSRSFKDYSQNIFRFRAFSPSVASGRSTVQYRFGFTFHGRCGCDCDFFIFGARSRECPHTI